MNYFITLITLILCFIQVFSMAKGAEARNNVLLTVEPGFSRIDYDDKETIFIDYHNFCLFRFELERNRCVSFPFSPYPDEKAKLFAKIEYKGLQAEAMLDGLQYPVVRLLFGPDAMRLRTATTPRLGRYGQVFIPAVVDFLLMPDAAHYIRLREIAEYNEQYYQQVPLLRQLDVLGLIKYLGALPLLQKSKSAQLAFEFRAVPKGEARRGLPPSCLAADKEQLPVEDDLTR